MKKLLTVLTILTTVIGYNSLYSQNKPVQKHLAFMGIPINGELSDFVEKMKNKGFTTDTEDTEDTETNVVTMKGKFAGEDVDVWICTTLKSNTVRRVIVFFRKRDNWSSLETNYNLYKRLLISKYGEPTLNKETFEDKYISGNSSKIKAIEDDKCKYWSEWHFSSGWIHCKITSNKTICIMYVDIINDKLNDNERKKDI